MLRVLAKTLHPACVSASSVSASTARGLTTTATPLSASSIGLVKLNTLSDMPGASKAKTRVGRGRGSGRGKTSKRGHKGQKARSGGGPARGFEGGQTPLMKRLPKRGFTNPSGVSYVPLNLDRVQDAVSRGVLDATKPVTMRSLVNAGLVSSNSVKDGIKLLAGSSPSAFRVPLSVEVSAASSAAIEAIERAGGKIKTVYFNRLGLRALLKPHTFDIPPRLARPPPRLLAKYQSYEHRGYLAPEFAADYPEGWLDGLDSPQAALDHYLDSPTTNSPTTDSPTTDSTTSHSTTSHSTTS